MYFNRRRPFSCTRSHILAILVMRPFDGAVYLPWGKVGGWHGGDAVRIRGKIRGEEYERMV